MDERLFFAIDTICPWPEEFPEGRVLLEKDRHMTLAFLGETNATALMAALPKAPVPAFRIGLAGCFDEPLFLPVKHPRTAGWHVRLFEGEETFFLYRQQLVDWLVEAGFLHRPERDFLPHTTIARNPKNLSEWKDSFSSYPLYLRDIHLYRSLGRSRYESLWSYPILAPFEEVEHTADLAFLVRGKDWDSLYLHAGLALAFEFPPLLAFFEIKKPCASFAELIVGLNDLVSKADAELGAPFKAVSYHGDVTICANGIWEWEMIVDV